MINLKQKNNLNYQIIKKIKLRSKIKTGTSITSMIKDQSSQQINNHINLDKIL